MLAATLLCLVVGVSDGDTLTARCGQPGEYQQIKVRLGGIDAPESRQPFGARAKQALSDLAYNKQAELRCNKIDRYKRHVCSVWVAPALAPDGPRTLDAGLAMVAQAWPGGIATTPASRALRSAGSTNSPSKKPRPSAWDFGPVLSQ